MKEKISIIIPVYNTEPILLRACVESAMEQTHGNIEIIIIDDGSQKKTTIEACICLSKVDKRIKLIRQKNAGESGARKTGIDAAEGEFILFLDSDDCLYKDACEYLETLISSGDYDLAEAVSCEVQDIKTIPDRVHNEQKLIVLENSKQLLRNLCEGCLSPMSWSVWAKLYKTDKLKRSYRVHSDIYRGVDVLTLAQYIATINKSIHSNKVIYCYNKGNTESLTAQKYSLKNLTMLKLWKEMLKCYGAHASEESISKVRAIYLECLVGCILECKYCKYPDYVNLIRKMKKELSFYYGDIIYNKYLCHRFKDIVVITIPWIYSIYWQLKKIKQKELRK